MDLAWSDDLHAEAVRTRDRVSAELAALGVPGDLELTGAVSVPRALTKGDVDYEERKSALFTAIIRSGTDDSDA